MTLYPFHIPRFKSFFGWNHYSYKEVKGTCQWQPMFISPFQDSSPRLQLFLNNATSVSSHFKVCRLCYNLLLYTTPVYRGPEPNPACDPIIFIKVIYENPLHVTGSNPVLVYHLTWFLQPQTCTWAVPGLPASPSSHLGFSLVASRPLPRRISAPPSSH